MQEIEMWLIHPGDDAVAAFRARAAEYPGVVVYQLPFEELPPHDCFVTAGNAVHGEP